VNRKNDAGAHAKMIRGGEAMRVCRRSGAFLFSLVCAVILCEMSLTTRPSAYPQSDAKFSLSTSSFPAEGDIPARFTCSGDNLSPALAWSDPPAGTQSLALIVDDPDAPGGVFNHWLIYDLPASTRQLAEGVPKKADLDVGRQGRNGFDEVGYGGPCPPPGHVHRYYFRLYALDQQLDVPASASKNAVEKAMKGHVLAQAEMMGKFKR
jgi:Raf kinase inhibitor-like YbhB/YbcL family protein